MGALDKVIGEAAVKAKAGKLEGALDVLLAAWPKNPSRELSDAIIALDAKLGLPPFEGDNAAWKAAVRKAKPSQWGPLLASITGKKLADAVDRMDFAHDWAADPRTANTLATLVANTPWSSDTSKNAWRSVYALVAASKSPRFVELAPSLKWNVRALIKGWLSNGFANAIEGLPAQWAPVDAATAKALVALAGSGPAKKAGARDDAALLADIYARPDDDAPRLVYADMLQERGDPRGEFIALQISAPDLKREKALISEHGKKWLGTIAPVLGAEFEFRRGFLSKASAKFRNQADAEKHGNAAEWATIEDLTWIIPGQIPQGQEPYVRFLGPTMKPGKRVEGAWAPSLLAAKKPWQFEEAMGLGMSSPRDFKAILDSPLFPKLRALGVSSWIDATWFSGITSMKNVKVLEVQMCRDLPRVLPLALKLGVERFTAWASTFERGPDGALSKLTITLDRDRVRHASSMISGLPEGVATSIDFVLPRGVTLDPELVKRAKDKIRPAGAKAPVMAEESEEVEIGYAREAGFTSDGSVIIADENVLHVLDATAQKRIRQFPIEEITAARVLPGGKQLVAIGYKRIHLFDLENGEDLVDGKTRDSSSESLNISDDGRFVSFARAGVFDLQKKAEVKGARGSSKALTLAPDQSWWLTYVEQGKPVNLLRNGSSAQVPLEGSETAKPFDWSSAGDALLTRTETHLMKWDTKTGQVTGKVAMKGHGSLWLSPRGGYVATQVAKETRVFETATLKQVGTVSMGYAIGLSDDGKKAVVCDNKGVKVEPIRS